MRSLSLIVVSTITQMELTKETIVQGLVKNKSLCKCRELHILRFIELCELLVLRIASKIIKYSEEYDVEKTTLQDLYPWYYTSLYEKEITSKKMVLLSSSLAVSTDKGCMQELEELLRIGLGQIRLYNNINIPIVEEVFEHLYDWMEEHILLTVALKIKCSSLILELEDIDCESASSFFNGEEVHLYVLDKYFLDLKLEHLLQEIVAILEKGHTDLNKVRLVLDLVFVEGVADKDYLNDIVKQFNAVFSSVVVINQDGEC